ncbi:MAG: hypothetical protein ACRDK1_09650 [Solirubrobacterales bacterium]
MISQINDKPVFPESESVLRRWLGRQVQVDLIHHASDEIIASIPQAALRRLDSMTDRGLADGVELTFGDGDGAAIFTLRVQEQLLRDALEWDSGLEISLDDLDIVIEQLPEA